MYISDEMLQKFYHPLQMNVSESVGGGQRQICMAVFNKYHLGLEFKLKHSKLS